MVCLKQQRIWEVGIMQVIETRLLYYFLTVARERNITSAAKTLHITQPTLSRQMALLEEEVGAKLFIRDSRPLSLTDEGLLFRVFCQALFPKKSVRIPCF